MNKMNTNGYIAFYILLVLYVAVATASNSTESAVTNVARHKETLQSHLSEYSSSLGVDGSTDQYVANGSCISIETSGVSWWQVDLGDIYTVFHVRVFLAKDCCDDTIVENVDCYSTPWNYRGKANTTVSGKSCRRWDSLDIHKHDRWIFALSYIIENFCGVPVPFFFFSSDGPRSTKPWCYTDDSYDSWEYCEIEQCEQDLFEDMNLMTGTQVKSLEIPNYKKVIDHKQQIWEFVLSDYSRARYIELQQDGSADYFPLCEVEVYGVKDDVTNVAPRKTTQVPARNLLERSCTYFADEDNPWWRVDLAGIYEIFLVRFNSEMDYYPSDVQLQVGTSLDTMFDAGMVEPRIEFVQNILLPSGIEARFVKLTQNGVRAFPDHLCVIEVFGKKAECEYDPCQNGGNCSVVYCGELENCRNYTCACAQGFGGIDCEVCTYNVAVGKQIEASSIHYKNWLSSNAIDGDTNQNVMFGATCVSTQKEIKPYLLLDLGDEYNITGVNVYRRLDCCPDDNYVMELFLLMSNWTSYGNTSGLSGNISMFEIYPYIATRYLKFMATEEHPVMLQLCEIEVFSICSEDFTLTTTTYFSHQTTVEQPMYYIQMRFSLSDKYSEVVKSEDTFKNLIWQGLSNQTGFSVDSFRNIHMEKDPFRVAFELHATDGNRETLNEMVKKIDTLNRFGILEIENDDGQLLAITAGSLQYHTRVIGNRGTRIDSLFLVAVSIIFTVIKCM